MLPPPVIELLLNIYRAGEVKAENYVPETSLSHQQARRRPTTAAKVIKLFPEFEPAGDYPEATCQFEVPFKLRDTTAVKWKPYDMPRERKLRLI